MFMQDICGILMETSFVGVAGKVMHGDTILLVLPVSDYNR